MDHISLKEVVITPRKHLSLLELIKKHPNVLENIVLYKYTAVIETATNKKPTQVNGVCAINKHFRVSAEWQIDYHIMEVYEAVNFTKKTIFEELNL